MATKITTTLIAHCGNKFCQSRYADVWNVEHIEGGVVRLKVSCACCGLRFTAERKPGEQKARFVPGTEVTS